MRSKSIVVYALVAAAVAVVCLALVCQVRNCVKHVSDAARITAGLSGSFASLTRNSGQTEPSQPSIVPPGHSALPRASRRPVFGNEHTEGTEITLTPTDEHGLTPTDTLKLRVGKDGAVTNLGRETLSIRVVKVGPAWIEWDLSLGLCAFVSKDREDWRPVARRGGYALDVGGKLKLLDIRPTLGLQIGIPALYATSGCFGVGCDFKVTGMEWVSLDVGYFPFAKRAAVGIGLNLP
jgi:hypothetical protein